MNNKITRKMLSDTVTDANEFLIFHKELKTDYEKLKSNISKSLIKVDGGGYITPCEIVLFPMSTRPRSLLRKGRQSDAIKRYKKALERNFNERKEALDLLKGKKVILYFIAYLKRENYEKMDVHNISYHFCNVLEKFIDDDKNIQMVIAEKKEVDTKSIDPDICEEFLIFLTHESYKKYLFR